MEKYRTGTGQTVLVHDRERCAGEYCCIHNPSDHHMRDWPTNWRGDIGLMERICKCGIGHPDPDDLAYKRRVMGKEADHFGVHGCCGCCNGINPYNVK